MVKVSAPYCCWGPMRRLYLRGGKRQYVPMGWFCIHCGALRVPKKDQAQLEALKS